MGEAFASGADEALAYESLLEAGREKDWPQVLASLMRWQYGGLLAAMLIGAAAYDPAAVNTALHLLGWHAANLAAKDVLRFPIYLTLLSAATTLAAAVAMTEPKRVSRPGVDAGAESTWVRIVDSARWIVRQPFVLAVILAGLCLDSVSRLFMTMTSNYLRLIGIPARYFGFILSSLMLLGMLAANLPRWLATKRTPGFNFTLLAAGVWLSLLALGEAFRFVGVLFIIPLSLASQCGTFLLSHYLNASVESSRRSTVLSFKGSALNAGYGLLGLFYAGLSSWLATGGAPKDTVFRKSLLYLPWYFLATAALVWWMGRRAQKAAYAAAL